MLLATVGYPIVYNFVVSFYDWYILKSPKPINPVGFGNYINYFKDREFWGSVGVTLKFTLISVSFEFLIGFGLALMLHELNRSAKFFKTILITPMLVSPLVMGLIWKLMWHADFGVVNYFRSLFALPPVAWLSFPSSAFTAVTITEIWQHTSFVFLVLFAAVQMLPAEPYEAAIIDGAGYWQRVYYITLPLLRMPILVAFMFRLIFTLRAFDKIWALTKGGPNSATMTLSMLMYRTGFMYFRPGASATLSIMLLFLTAIITVIFLKFFFKKGGNE
jgi:multiple sugar transport system permease protein